MEHLINLHEESLWLNGARDMLLKILDNYKIVPKVKGDKDDTIYTQAEIELILSSKENTREFLIGGMKSGVRYYEHTHDKKGKLVSCKAKFERCR